MELEFLSFQCGFPSKSLYLFCIFPELLTENLVSRAHWTSTLFMCSIHFVPFEGEIFIHFSYKEKYVYFLNLMLKWMPLLLLVLNYFSNMLVRLDNCYILL